MTRRLGEELAAFVGIDWADPKHQVCLQAAGSQKREFSLLAHQPDTMAAWVSTWRTRFKAQPLALWLELNKGPIVSALRQDAGLVRFPVHPLPLARYRQAFTPSPAKDDPSDAERQRELLLTHRDTRQPLPPQSPEMRALEHLVPQRRRLVGDKVRITNRLPSALKHYCPHVLPWLHDKDTGIFCDFLAQWPTLKAVQLARRSTLERFCRDQHVRYADVITQRLDAIKSATPLTTDEGLITPHALVVQALVAQLRVTLHAIEDCDKAIAPAPSTIPTSLYLTPSRALAPSLPHVSSGPLANHATATPRRMSGNGMLALRR